MVRYGRGFTRHIYPPRGWRASGGFTLIELLVVIAIIALLMGILMPALQRAKPAKVGAEDVTFSRVALPAQRRETRVVKDLFPRYKTMRGIHVSRRGGWDTHGLPVELEVEKRLGFTNKWQIEQFGIDKFNELCRKSAFDYIQEWEKLTERIGYWVERGFYLKQDYYNGINLAFLLNVRAALDEKLGARAEAIADFITARRIRRQVLQLCEEALKAQPNDYWILATMWEAAVGLEDDAAAAKWEERAKALAAEGWMLESTRSQLERLKGLLRSSPLKNL